MKPLLISAALILTLWVCQANDTPPRKPLPLPDASRQKIDFDRDIQPILTVHCLRCHGDKAKGGLRLSNRTSVLKGSENGPVIVAGKSSESLLIQLVAGQNPDKTMPPGKEKLTPEQVGLLRAWIDQGAKWGTASPATPPGQWAFQPLATPRKPLDGNPIDEFIRERLAKDKIPSNPEADRPTLIRRLTFDLVGLPPTPQEIDAFVQDRSPNAYEKVVDRLLAAPEYGERWARHWMDTVHYAETHGHDQDRVRPNAWRYRDYLIASFNADTAYPRFIQEQIAADVLFPDRPESTPALGFLACGPWDESSLRDIRDDSIDRQVGYYLDRDDILTTAMGTVVSLTVGCARCHDHKFDPISMEEYYQLQAVFAGVAKGNIAYDADPTLTKKRRELTARLKALEPKESREASVKASMQDSTFVQNFQKWIRQQSEKTNLWRPVAIQAVKAKESTLTPLPDGSIRSTHKKRPERESYTVTFTTKLPQITAVRLELLTDDSFPHRGPGLQDNGNLHLSEVTLEQGDQKVAMGVPVSDFDQDGWTIRHAVDGNPATAWGIYPKVGMPHEAIFPLTAPQAGDRTYTLRLDQLHGGGHLIGRFRISVTGQEKPTLAPSLPPNLAEFLSLPADRRTPAQQLELAGHYLRETLTKELAAVPAPQMVYALSPNIEPDGSHKPIASPRLVHLLKRGEIRSQGPVMQPGTLNCFTALPGDFHLKDKAPEGERRAALAKWLTDPRNPLVWRSIVNRVWQYHFGRGIVDSPNDFGLMGGKPTHPELLDFLAVWFRDVANGSIKKLHKLMVMTATYRQTSAHNPTAAAIDQDNRLLWRMPRTKLDAEQVRDAVLLVSGRLDRRRGGPSDQQFGMKPGIHVTPQVDYGAFNWDRPEGHRRSVYRFVFRTLPDPLVECLDGADASQLTPTRNSSVTAPQSLALLNNEFLLVHAKAMAKNLKNEADPITTACRRLWGRAPTPIEQQELSAYAKKHGLENACRVLFNTDDFLFAD